MGYGGLEGGLSGSAYGEVHIHIADSLCYTAETNTTLFSNYTPVNLLKKKDMETYDALHKEFKIFVLRKHIELQDNTKRQFNEIRKTIREQNENINKEIGTIKRNQTEIVELKNTMNEIKKRNREHQHMKRSIRRKKSVN